ncbi:hypothetical protein [Facklamia sp. P13055]
MQNIAIAGEKWQAIGQSIETVGKQFMPATLAVLSLEAFHGNEELTL